MEERYVVLTKSECNWCTMAKGLLTRHEKSFIEYDVIERPDLREFLQSNGLHTVPQVYLNGHLIGGYADLRDQFDGHPSN